ncbi:hypothetical protein [Shinella zoogloeoides]|uniref:Holin of 3TMs, for gene-transfer release n=1 Tax=Shinella zoogloeoides TaxID=352475 RepID=A0A6N8T882_SHIZO|nr:hypothetical protein [Shinella zoogloeoides]MXN99426.1 hypothetical protein [Shinella zoogloeoides]UEX82795.1 hypothetical protein K8M09_05815 [Shinella zoogloeoides]
MAASAIILEIATKIGAPIVKSILQKTFGGTAGDLAGTVIDAVAGKVGVPAEKLDSIPPNKIEAAVREVEVEAPEMIALWEAGLAGQFALLQAETAEGFWQSAWRWGWMYLLAFLWVCNFLLFPLARVFGAALDPIDSGTLLTLTGWFISLYMGGHTVKEIGKQALEAVKTWRGAHV